MIDDPLEAAWTTARRKRAGLVEARKAERDARLHDAAAEIDMDLRVKYGAAIEAATVAEEEARAAYEAALVERGKAALAASPGVFVKWTRERGWDKTYKPGARAVLEVRDHGTPMPGNIAQYSLPKIGEPFLRALKGDGSKGLKIYKLGWRETVPSWPWLPEGVDGTNGDPAASKKGEG